MKSNFKLLLHDNSDSLHIKLIGDFDTGAARALLNSLSKHRRHFRRIFVHTSCLSAIDSVGGDAFRNDCELGAGARPDLIFTGEHAEHIAPPGAQIL